MEKLIYWLSTFSEFLEQHDGAITAMATVFIAFFTIALAISTTKLWKESKAAGDTATIAANAAKESAHASVVALRPWLSCKAELAEPLTYVDGDAVFMFNFVVKNYGQSPAMSISFSPNLTLSSTQNPPPIHSLMKHAVLNRDMPVDAMTLTLSSTGGANIGSDQQGLVLFPNETHIFRYKIPIKRSEIEKSCKDIKPNLHFFPEVSGIVTYTYPLAKIRADTGFVNSIEVIGGAFELDNPVSLDEIRIDDRSMWGFAT